MCRIPVWHPWQPSRPLVHRPLVAGLLKLVTASLITSITSLPPATLTLTGPAAHQALIWLGLVWPH